MSKQYFNSLTRSIAVLGLIAVSNPLGLSPVLAAPTVPNVEISNQATGTFTDGDEPGAQPESIVSNVVTITVAEVAGITITADNTPEPYSSALVNFDFEIKNIGNDPTKFFLPKDPASVVGGTAGTLQIVAYVDANGVKTPLSTPINIATAGDTGSFGDGTLGSNTTAGSIPAGAAIIVRVPVTVTAAVNANVRVTLGNTTAPQSGINDPYIASGNDVYTVDNADTVVGEAAGVPINGDGITGDGDVTKHRQEASATNTVLVQNPPLKISGTVFEDVNYGGGAGRDLVSSAGVARPNVRVEIYNDSGVIRGQMLTDTNGRYVFDASNVIGGLTQGNTYQIRVVNSFVTSSRSGGCALAAAIDLPPDSCFQVPVQTFRTSGDTDNNNIADADPDRVGGEVPSKKDAPANSGSQTLSALNSVAGQAVESLTTVVLGSAPFTGVDFGFNFDTIVNTNNIGQGSLRQFVTNSNTLLNTGLTQVGQTAGQEVSIFMIPRGAATPGIQASIPSQLTGGVAVINIATVLPPISDPNTTIDGTTQTTNVGDTNSSTFGTGGTVGVDNISLAKVDKPEVELSDGGLGVTKGFEILANDTTIRGMSIWGFGKDRSQNEYYNQVTIGNFSGTITARTLIEKNIIGTKATDFSVTGSPGRGSNTGDLNTGGGIYLLASTDTTIKNNLIGFNAGTGILSSGNNDSLLVSGNEIRTNGTESARDGLGLENGTKNSRAINNLIIDNAANGISIYKNSVDSKLLVENNTIQDSGRQDQEKAGIAAFETNGGNDIISKNIITGSRGAGVWLQTNVSTMKITQNSIYNNGGLGIDLKGGDSGTDQTIITTSTTPTVNSNDGSNTVADIANIGIDYPIITSSSISGGTLTVKGYVGNLATGSPTFAGATIEFFVGAPDTNDKGKVFSTDPTTVSKLHAEGQTYIGGSTPGNLCITDANGFFSCSFPNAGAIDAKNITATATDAAGNTSEFSASNIDPRVLLVKRITAINGSKNTFNGDNLANYLQDEANPYDDNVIETLLAPSANFPAADTTFWPGTIGKTSSDFLLGGMNGGNIKPKDVIEYTIYFLSNGDSTATNVLFCDRVPANVTFMPTAFDSSTIKAPGGVTESRGILTQLNGITASYTNVADGDAARYFPAGNDPKLVYPKVNCGGTNDNGAVVVDLGSLPNATAVGTPGSYGFVRFQGRVK